MQTHAFDLVIYAVAAALVLVAYLRDPGLPMVGFRAGGQLLLEIMPRLVAAMIMTGMLQVLISPEWIHRMLGEGSGQRGIFVGFVAGVLTPGGPMVGYPIMAAFYQSGAAVPALVSYITAWSLFGIQRIFAWELPFMGLRFTLARVLPTLVFPILAGYLVHFLYRD
jgi:uncharacterized membrane protein YraQ (UPF0718 family)